MTTPAGIIIGYGGALPAPAGWLACDGSFVSQATYADLFAEIGHTFAIDPGDGTFALPNLESRVPLGKAAAGTGSTLGGTGGAASHTHTGPSHSHSYTPPGDHGSHSINQPSAHGSHTIGQAAQHSDHDAHAVTQHGAHGSHTVTQPDAHAAHSVTQPGNHSVTQPSAHGSHTIGQPTTHATHSSVGGHAHDAHTQTTTASSGASTVLTGPAGTHSSQGAHQHSDAIHAHAGWNLDAHSAHSGMAVDAHALTVTSAHTHSGLAVDAHDAHGSMTVTGAHAHSTAHDAALDAHSAHSGADASAHSSHSGGSIAAGGTGASGSGNVPTLVINFLISDGSADVPAGAVLPYGATSAPTDWIVADGSSLVRLDHPDLFTALGTAYGAVDGTHFSVPDFRGRHPLGKGGVLNRGDTAGALDHTHTGPSHTHSFTEPSAHSDHTITQASGHSNHSATQPTTHAAHGSHTIGQSSAHADHTVTAELDAHGSHTIGGTGAHSVTQAAAHSAHSVTQPSDHGTHGSDGAHTHDTHTSAGSSGTSGSGTQRLTAPTGAHSSVGGHAHDAHSSHAGMAVDSHSAHANAAFSSHLGTALDAHSAHGSTTISGSHSAHDAALDAHSAHGAHSGFGVDAHSAHAGAALDAHSAHSGGAVQAAGTGATGSANGPYLVFTFIVADVETTVPVGAAFGVVSATDRSLDADGASYLRTDEADLFDVIGTLYGAADGTHFNVPDLRGRIPLGLTAAGTGSTMGESGGAIDHTHTGPSHAHTLTQSSTHTAHVATQPSDHDAHSVDQLADHAAHSNHSATQSSSHSSHTVNSPAAHSNHSATQPSDHTTTSSGDAHSAHSVTQSTTDHGTHAANATHTHNAHTGVSRSSGAVTMLNGPLTHAANTTHTHDAHDAHAGATATGAHTHSGAALDSHSGFAVNAHDGHSNAALTGAHAHSGFAVDAHSAHSAHGSTSVSSAHSHSGWGAGGGHAHSGATAGSAGTGATGAANPPFLAINWAIQSEPALVPIFETYDGASETDTGGAYSGEKTGAYAAPSESDEAGAYGGAKSGGYGVGSETDVAGAYVASVTVLYGAALESDSAGGYDAETFGVYGAAAEVDTAGAYLADEEEPPAEEEEPATHGRVSRAPRGLGIVRWKAVSPTGQAFVLPIGRWECLETSAGGYISMSGDVEGSLLDRFPAALADGALIRGYLVATEELVWAGRTLDLARYGGRASLIAEGLGLDADQSFERLLWQNADPSTWIEMASDPAAIPADEDKFNVDINDGRIKVSTVEGTELVGDETHGAAFVASPEIITRLQFTLKVYNVVSDRKDKYAVRLFGGTGPPYDAGSWAQIGSDIDLATWSGTTDVDLEIDSAPTMIALQLARKTGESAASAGAFWVRFVDPKVNGRALGEEYGSSSVVRDLAAALGISAFGVSELGGSALPLDRSSVTAADVAQEMALLVDGHWGVYDSGARAYWSFGRWDEQTYYAPTTHGIRPVPQRRFDSVAVPHRTSNPKVNGMAVADAPYKLRKSRQFLVPITGDLPDEETANSIAAVLAPYLVSQRYAGDGTLFQVIDHSGQVWSAHRIRAGHQLVVPGYGEAFRLTEVRRTDHGVDVVFDDSTNRVAAAVNRALQLARA